MLAALPIYRLDVAVLALMTGATGWFSQRVVCGKCKASLPAETWPALGAAVLTVALFAEWAGSVAPGARPPVVWLGALLVATIIATAARLALARAETWEQNDNYAELQRTKDLTDVRNRAKSEFLAVISHEIRTPLTAVIGFASVLSETKLDKTQRRYLDTVINAGERVVALLNDILDFSKLEEGRLAIDRVAFVPALLIHEVVDLLMPRAADKRLNLHFDDQLGGPLTIVGDPTRIRQIVLNLVANAIQFTDAGSVILRAEWEPPARGNDVGTLTVRVTDTGIGINPSKLKSLFQLFTQADSSNGRRYGGGGIGLTICHRLVELMGGRISVESTLGRGSQFTVTLPCAIGHSDTAAPESMADAARTAAFAGARGRVLVVDDQQLNRELLKLLLRRHGYETDLASSGKEAVELARANAYAVVFMDLEMPEMDGFVTTAQLRGNEPAGRHVPIVAVTANTEPGTREKCLAAGMDDYLTKPVFLPALKSTLEAMTAFQRTHR